MNGLPWAVPDALWRDRVVVVIATGESVTPAVVETIRAAHVDGRCAAIAVNDAFRVAPWADMLYAADGAWWNVHAHRGALQFSGYKVTAQRVIAFPVMVAQISGHQGFDERPGFVRTGSNSAYQATHIAAQLGARKIVLVGVDMKGSHFFGLHPEPLRNTVSFNRYIEMFETISKPLKDRGVDVVNVSPISVLKTFRRGELAQELQ